MKRLLVLGLFLNAALLAGRLIQESNARGGEGPSRNGDINCDGTLDLSDAVGILQFLFNGGPEPCAFAGDAGIEDRVAALEGFVAELQRGGRRERAALGVSSVRDVEQRSLNLRTDILARLSEIHATATAGEEVGVDFETANGVLGEILELAGGVKPIAPINTRVLNRPGEIGRETDAAANAINTWIAAVNETVESLNSGYARAFTEITLLEARGEAVPPGVLLDAMVAKNLDRLHTVVHGPEFRNACAELEDLLDSWDERLSTIGDDAQLANLDLQSLLQQMELVLQTISVVANSLHDTSMAVIRNIRG